MPTAALAAPVDGPGLDVWSGMTIGASVALLVFASLGNLLLAVATGQRAYGYYALWAAMVPGWGLFETRLAGLLMPHLDPSHGAATATMFVVLAVASAALGLRTAVAAALPAWLTRAIDTVIIALLSVGLINMIPDAAGLLPYGRMLQGLTLFGVLLAAIACRLAWRFGAAREFAVSFTIPTVAMVGTFDVPPFPLFAPGSGDFVVLGACALQALCLMLIAARRLLTTAIERDTALTAGRHMAMLAEQDPLTNLLNRRGFVARAEAILETPGAGFVLLDLDHFKCVNDSFGHDVGDELLCAIANALCRAAGDALVGRMGGEEFAVAVPAHADAMVLADRLRAAVAAVRLDEAGEATVTASAGVAVLTQGEGFADAYRLADRGLIAAKRQGRNRTCLMLTSVETLVPAHG